MHFEFKRHRIDKVSRERALEALEKAAERFGYAEFGKREFNRADVGVSASGVRNAFGSWATGMEALRSRLRERGLELTSKTRAFITDQHLFAEMERIGAGLGHRPSRYECENASPNPA